MKKQIKIKKFKKSGLISACPMKFASGASKYFIGVIFLLISVICVPQNVGINEPNPDNSALLEMTSTVRGLLVPRMTAVERDAIVSPAEGLLIYNTNDTCLNLYRFDYWYNMCCCGASTPCVAPAITSQPVDVSINDGDDANYSVTATGTAPLTYQWQENTGSGWSDITNGGGNPAYSGATTASLTLTTVPVTYDTYDYQCIVTNACGTDTSNSANLTVSSFTCGTSTVNDIDGNTYNTVLIGTQCWLKENMRTTKYPDNTIITKGPSAHGDPGWTVDLSYYSCPPDYPANTAEDCAAAATLGLLYQWSAAMDGAASCNGIPAQPECTTPVQGICPDGWHIPSHYEWTQLEQVICSGNGGGTCNTDFPYNETLTGWLGTNGEGSDMANDVTDQSWNAGNLRSDANFTQSGFDLGPSGYRHPNGNYYDRGDYTTLWSSTEGGTNAWIRYLYYSMTSVRRHNFYDKAIGFSVRCLKD